MQRAIQRQGAPFLQRLFTTEELRYARSQRSPAVHLAARFAAKEAVAKAFGDRRGLTMRWHDVTVVHTSSGQPKVLLAGAAQRLQRRRRVRQMHLSLTHTAEYAVAMVVLEQQEA